MIFMTLVLAQFIIFWYFCCWCGGSSAHTEDIMRFRCGGGEPHSLLKNLKIFVLSGFGEFSTIFDWL